MKRCSAKPYEGDDKYIFVSYCHKDKAKVFPIIEQLAKDGYRIWYDEGIDPGSEWPEIIAQHLNGCSAFFAFITENSLNSHNCRREINFALLKQKLFISVILESVKMSPGIEMQLSATQSIFKYLLDNEYDFFKKIYSTKTLDNCKGEPDFSVVISNVDDYAGEVLSDKVRDPFGDWWFEEKKEEIVETNISETNPDSEESTDNDAEQVAEELARQEAERKAAEKERITKEKEEAEKKRLEEEERIRKEKERKLTEEKLRIEKENAEKERQLQEKIHNKTEVSIKNEKQPSKKKLIVAVSAIFILLISIVSIIFIASSDVDNEIQVTGNMLWGTHDAGLDVFRETTIKLLRDEEEFTVYMIPKEISVNPEKENIIELVFIDEFDVTFKTLGKFTIEDNIISISPCDDETLYDTVETYKLSEEIEYLINIKYGSIELKIPEDFSEYGECAYYDNKLARNDNIVQLSGKKTENTYNEISEINVSYNLVADEYECEIKFPDGKAVPLECRLDDNVNYLYVNWEEEIRNYNGREETFNEWNSLGITFVNTYPYGFVIVGSTEEDMVLYTYQEYSKEDISTDESVETTENAGEEYWEPDYGYNNYEPAYTHNNTTTTTTTEVITTTEVTTTTETTSTIVETTTTEVSETVGDTIESTTTTETTSQSVQPEENEPQTEANVNAAVLPEPSQQAESIGEDIAPQNEGSNSLGVVSEE